MMGINTNKKTIILALLVIIIGVASFIVLGYLISRGGPVFRPATYPNGPGFRNAMTWFELAASKDEVFQVLGNPKEPQGAHIRQVMDAMNRIDYYYMALYSLMCLLIWALTLHLNQRKHDAGPAKTWISIFFILLCLGMFIGDVMENAQLLKLTGYMGQEDIDDTVVTALNIWTRVKWGAIFIYAMAMSSLYFAYFREKQVPRMMFTAVYGFSAILGLISLTMIDRRHLVEPASYLVALAWLISIIHGGIVLKANVAARNN